MKNVDVRSAAKAAGVHLWQIADHIGVSEATFFRHFRKELPDYDKQRMLLAIAEIAKEAKQVC